MTLFGRIQRDEVALRNQHLTCPSSQISNGTWKANYRAPLGAPTDLAHRLIIRTRPS